MLWQLYDELILDLDGVVYIGANAVPHAVNSLNALQDQGVLLTAATNNASRPTDVVHKHLTTLGLNILASNILSSAQAAASLMKQSAEPGATILAVGGDGVEECLRTEGFHVLRAVNTLESNNVIADEVVGVVQGHGVDSGWWDFCTAMWAITRGAVWIATNRDSTVPLEFGLGPGNGTFVEALSRVSGKVPLVAGKPEPTLFQEVQRRTQAHRPLVIGDRLDTDIDAALAAGMDSVLVLTGVHGIDDVRSRSENLRPTYICRDLRELLEKNPDSLRSEAVLAEYKE